ncbi:MULTISPECIES: homocysteine S-methyltransferase family protein [unclassified Pseudomonas]|uniref:homocysteine S-methyltransferase family protein n=1 Tax=unclassified Pseudomonas TaxID=196821 RepID=UPI000356E777|nr:MULTISPECIES: homocysteine S-methyltransferase family protein [unclassified Pseudomonas]MBK3430585.1 homocysteine S-methyltransferase family protein [Pseudomonas fluorescens]EPL07468.1 homocysteine S-methyltransferase family protein [Pseudomonas sp. CF150]MBK3482245.1 homocysteine S-methyltransferase family protein [Pseudomonas fluorescens]MCF5507766.1 homocysteine S-methyltransferase [Pseudomonas sp. PA-3-6H]MCF5513258.1 homocysteine S-methyltransferase [Pseudomonas sp. PA-3-6E]
MGAVSTVILDGGMGRELQRRGAPFRQPEWSALALSEAPQAVEAVHAAYIDSGANVITSNSYAVVPFHIGEARFAQEGQALAALAGELARRAVQASGKAVQVAGSLPPLFGSYRPDLFQAERVSELLTPLVNGLAPHVDLWLAETQSSIAEARAIQAGLPKDGKPFWLSFTLKDEDTDEVPRLRSGEPVADAAEAAAQLGVQVLLFNCSQPEVIGAAIDAARKTFDRLGVAIQIGAYANAFPPQPKEATANDGLDPLRDDLDPPGYLQWAADWQARGASHLGGCCGIGPEHIAVLAQRLTD